MNMKIYYNVNTNLMRVATGTDGVNTFVHDGWYEILPTSCPYGITGHIL